MLFLAKNTGHPRKQVIMPASIPPMTLEKFTTFGDLLRYLEAARWADPTGAVVPGGLQRHPDQPPGAKLAPARPAHHRGPFCDRPRNRK